MAADAGAGGRGELPGHVTLLRDFANTLDLEDGSDALPAPAALTAWLQERGLLPADATAGRHDLSVAHELRAGLRAAMTAHHETPDGPGSTATPVLEAVSTDLPLRLAFTADPPRLVPVHRGVSGALATLLVAVTDAVADGSWERLKICPAQDCRWAFYDTSRNRSRTWCAMGVCGNRQKTRAYRARRREAPDPGSAPAGRLPR